MGKLQEQLILHAPEQVGMKWAREGHKPREFPTKEEPQPSLEVIDALVDIQGIDNLAHILDPYITDSEWIRERYSKSECREEQRVLAGLEHAPLDLAFADLKKWKSDTTLHLPIGTHPVFRKVTFVEAVEHGLLDLLGDQKELAVVLDVTWTTTMESHDPEVILESLKAVRNVLDLRSAIAHLPNHKTVRDNSGTLRREVFEELCTKLSEHAVLTVEDRDSLVEYLLSWLTPSQRRYSLPEDLEGPLISFLTHLRADDTAWEEFTDVHRSHRFELPHVGVPSPVVRSNTRRYDDADSRATRLPLWMQDLAISEPTEDITVSDVDEVLSQLNGDMQGGLYESNSVYEVGAEYLAKVSQVIDQREAEKGIESKLTFHLIYKVVAVATKVTFNWKTLEAMLHSEDFMQVVDVLAGQGSSRRYDVVKKQMWEQVYSIMAKRALLTDVSFVIDDPEFRKDPNWWLARSANQIRKERTFGWSTDPRKVLGLAEDLDPEVREPVLESLRSHPKLDGSTLLDLHARGWLKVDPSIDTSHPRTISHILATELGESVEDTNKWSLVADLYEDWWGATWRDFIDTVKAVTED